VASTPVTSVCLLRAAHLGVRGTGALLALLVALVLAGCGSSASDAPVKGFKTSHDDGYHGVLLDEPYAVPGVALTDTDGKPFDLAAQDKRTLVFFGYTNCPDICQIVMSTIVSAVSRLSPEERRKVQVAFVTTDPARDTPAKLRTYLDRFDPEYVGLTGPIKRIDKLAKPMDVFIKKGEKLPSGGYAVDHSTVVVAVDQGAGDLVWTGGTSPADMAEDLDKILAAKQ
jgi:protein SCO1